MLRRFVGMPLKVDTVKEGAGREAAFKLLFVGFVEVAAVRTVPVALAARFDGSWFETCACVLISCSVAVRVCVAVALLALVATI